MNINNEDGTKFRDSPNQSFSITQRSLVGDKFASQRRVERLAQFFKLLGYSAKC